MIPVLPGRQWVAAILAACVLHGCQTIDEWQAEGQPDEPVPVQQPAETENFEQPEADLAAGRLQEAQVGFLTILARQSNNPRALVGLGETLMAGGDYTKAFGTFQTASGAEGYEGRARQGQGLASLALDDPENAGTFLREAVDYDPNLWRAWNGLGRVYDLERNFTEAGAAYQKALALAPRSPIVLNNQGMSHMLQRQFPEATAKLEAALRHDPDSETIRNNLRLALAWQGMYDQALLGADTVGDEAGRVYNNVGYVALRRGDYEVAERLLNRALEMSPSFNQDAYENLQYLQSVVKARTSAE